jgi:hypothetical protein
MAYYCIATLNKFCYMKRLVLIGIVCCIVGACNQTPEMRAFDKYKKNIPVLKFPFKTACSDSIAQLKLNISDSLLKKYAPAGTTGIIGIIKDTDYYTAILYVVAGDMKYPVIQTCNPEGVKLNDIGLINGVCCGSAENCSGYSWGEITGSMNVILRDSERVFTQDTVKGAFSKIKFKDINTTEVYHITDSGYIRLKTPEAQVAQQSAL